MKPNSVHKVTSAPPSTPDVKDVEVNNNFDDENIFKKSDESFSSPDMWNNKVNVQDTSTSDIFDEDDSENELIGKAISPDAIVSEDATDDDSVKSLNIDQNSPESISIKNLDDTDSITSKTENSSTELTPPTRLLKVNSSSPEYLDLYSQDVFDVNTITVDKFYESRSTQDSENTFLSELKTRPKTCYKLQNMSVFNISSEIAELVPHTVSNQSNQKGDQKLQQKKLPGTKKNSVLDNLENMFYMDEEGKKYLEF